jgi:hypothetical protein
MSNKEQNRKRKAYVAKVKKATAARKPLRWPSLLEVCTPGAVWCPLPGSESRSLVVSYSRGPKRNHSFPYAKSRRKINCYIQLAPMSDPLFLGSESGDSK